MLDKFYYQNSFGERLNFGQDGLFASYNDLRDYQWGYETDNGIIGGFKRGIISKSLPCIFLSDNPQTTRELRNRAYSIVEKDVVAGKKGRLYLNDYFLECNIYGMTNSEYLESQNYLKTTMVMCSDKPGWVSYDTHSFKHQEAVEISDKPDYPFDYSRDLLPRVSHQQILDNKTDFAAGFIMTIYGAVINPEVIINNHTYSLNCTIDEGDTVVIHSEGDVEKSVTKYHNGIAENYFNKRNKESTVFEPVQNGVNSVAWNNEFDFDIALIDKRSEPKWSWYAVKVGDVTDIEQIGDTFYLLDADGRYIRDNNNEPIAVESGGNG